VCTLFPGPLVDIMRKFFYGYWIVLAGFITLTLSSGLTFYGFSVMNQSVAADPQFHWSPGQVTLAFTFFAVAMAVTSPLVGRLTDKRGPRQVLVIGTVVLALSLVLLSTISSLWSYCLLHFALGMSMTILGAVPISVLISNWFHRRRATMQGLSFIGLGFGGFAFGPPIRNYLIPNLGWRHTYVALALLSAVIMALVILCVVRNQPRDKGLSPYGAGVAKAANDRRPETEKAAGLTVRETLSRSAFWLISLTAAVYGMGLNGGLQNLERILTARPEFTPGDAAFAVGVVGLSSAAGKFVFGYLCDRIDPKYTTAAAYAFTASSLAVLTLAHSVYHLWLFGILLGLGMGGWAPNTATLAANYFGQRQYGTILGNIHLIFMLGEAVGPALVGRVYDQTLTYNTILLILSVLCAAGIPLIIIIRKPKLTSAGNNELPS
jgi:MFS family permease